MNYVGKIKELSKNSMQCSSIKPLITEIHCYWIIFLIKKKHFNFFIIIILVVCMDFYSSVGIKIMYLYKLSRKTNDFKLF